MLRTRILSVFLVCVVFFTFTTTVLGQRLRAVAEIAGQDNRCMAFSSRGILAVGLPEGIRLYDGSFNSVELLNEQKNVNSLSFSSDGELLASGSGDGTIKLWDMSSQESLVTISERVEGKLHEDDPDNREVTFVALSSDGKILASSSADEFDIIKIRRVNGAEFVDVAEELAVYLSIALSSDGKLFAMTGLNGVNLYDTRNMERVTAFEHPEAARVAFSPDGRWLASGGTDGTFRVWDMATKEVVFAGEQRIRILDIAFSPNSKFLAVSSSDSTMNLLGMVRIWDFLGKRSVVEIPPKMMMSSAIAFSPNGKWLAVRHFDAAVTIWDVSSLNGGVPGNSNEPGQAVEPKEKLVTTWGAVKRSK